jgi:N-acetylneuraminate synthase
LTFITAEIGINHNGDLQIAKKLIKSAKDAGCNAVKFQKRTVDKAYSQELLDSPRESPWGNTQRDQKNGLEFILKQYNLIDKYCKKLKISWFVSCWDIQSQIDLRKFKTKYNKIASAMLTHEKLLKTVAEERKHTFISTGMSTINQISKAVSIFRKNKCSFELMHSHSAYPMSIEEANLKVINTLRKRFNCKVGYSGHETEPYLACILAVALGASSIERHITLDRSMYGSDQAASLEPGDFKRMVRDVRNIDNVLGNGKKAILDSQLLAKKRLHQIISYV